MQGRLIPDPADYENLELCDELAGLSSERREEIEKATFEAEMRDPDGVYEIVKYPPFFWWRFEQVFGDSDEFLIVTPDMMDEYFKEPEDPMQSRCPRCYSIKIDFGYPYIQCLNCGYNEPLIDFPISHYYHLALESSMTNVKRCINA